MERSLQQAVLFAPNTTVVAIGGLEELEPTIQRITCDACAQVVHFGRGHGCEVARDFEILLEDLPRIDAAYERSDRKTQHVSQGFFGGDDPLLDGLCVPAHAFHSERRDAPLVQDWQNFLFKTPVRSVEHVQRQLTGVEGKVLVQHLEMNLGMFVARESNKPHLALLSGLEERVSGTAWDKVPVRIVFIHHLVNLPEIQIVGLETTK